MEESSEVSEAPIAGIGTMVFGKWDASEVVCSDPGISRYVNLRMIGAPHTGGRHANAWFGKQDLSVTERFINNLMRSGKYSGKKQYCAKSLEEAFDRINSRTGRIHCRSSLMQSQKLLLVRRQHELELEQLVSQRPLTPLPVEGWT